MADPSRPIAPRPRPFQGQNTRDVIEFLQRNAEWSNLLVTVVNQIMNGRINAVGTLTFRASQTTTTLSDTRVANQSVLILTPLTSAAATAYAAGWHVSARTPGTSLVITHASNAATTQDFGYALIG